MRPRLREPVGARFARKRETGTDGFTRQWSHALNDNLEMVPYQKMEFFLKSKNNPGGTQLQIDGMCGLKTAIGKKTLRRQLQ